MLPQTTRIPFYCWSVLSAACLSWCFYPSIDWLFEHLGWLQDLAIVTSTAISMWVQMLSTVLTSLPHGDFMFFVCMPGHKIAVSHGSSLYSSSGKL